MHDMYAAELGKTDRVLGPTYLAAAFVGIGLPIVTAGVLIAALFSPGLWTFVPLVMLAVFLANLANVLVFIALHRARVAPEPLRNVLRVGAVFSGICLSTVLVLAAWFASLGG